MLDILFGWLFPRRCAICGEVIVSRDNMVCDTCRGRLVYIREPKCKKCGKAVLSEEQEYCYDCTKQKFRYKRGYAVFEYNDVMRRSMSDFKFHGCAQNVDFYVDEIVRLYGDVIKMFKPDVLVPVPVHSTKKRKRGYNQAELIARGIGKRLEIPVASGILKRDKRTLPQKQLNPAERMKNLEKAFSINSRITKRDRADYERIMLVDDIYTTGSTIEACTGVLLESGIREVEFISVCIGKGY